MESRRTVHPIPGAPHGTDLTRRVQKWLTAATLIVPSTMLAYAVIDVRVGVQHVDLAVLPAAVLGLLFTVVTSLLVGLIGVGDHRAIRVAAVICAVFDKVFILAAMVYLWFALTALTHVLGIRYFVAELDSPVLTTFQAGVLAALSTIAWRVVDNSADLLAGLKR
ncbi:hypothetical protein SAMN05192558_109237 [Actinokineospora alba]|uniref:Uncharacterized protein n=2 Tax=Actinokineospora alba TaxID=504798 RepID=A0A1H0T2N1_9PSEU|nr:hypothetical protein C8E96_1903 [Actinokineospora alba]SDJ24004.1 hypothetical protein SAMN05421871_111137 [Actinokineospora alba]SDP48303.1 hypothetical protein SAMN05192558_109237 [Actinokineospora alba]